MGTPELTNAAQTASRTPHALPPATPAVPRWRRQSPAASSSAPASAAQCPAGGRFAHRCGCPESTAPPPAPPPPLSAAGSPGGPTPLPTLLERTTGDCGGTGSGV